MKNLESLMSRTSTGAAAALSLCVLAFGVSTGCGTIIHGRTEQVQFTSNPPGATVTIAGYGQLVTPASIELDRSDKHAVTFSLDGYEDQEIRLKNGLSGWFLVGNLVFGGIPGWVIDLISGAAGDLSPDDVHVDFMNPGSADGA